MSTEQNKEVVKRWNLEIVNGHQLEAFGEVLAPDYTNHGGTKGPWSTIQQGLDEVKASWSQALAQYPTARVTLEDMIAEGDKVAIRLTTYVDDKPVAQSMSWYRLQNGKIVDDWFVWRDLDQG
jgi:predicted SnoaL-like aldol condensation-catalyzing enzyme